MASNKFPPLRLSVGPNSTEQKLADRAFFVAAACNPYDIPADLVVAFNARHLDVQAVHEMLRTATGAGRRKITPAGVQQVRVALQAYDRAREVDARKTTDARALAVAGLLDRYVLRDTKVGTNLAASDLPADVLARMLEARANSAGKLDAAAQAALMRELTLAAGRGGK